MTTRAAVLPCWTDRMQPSMTRSLSCGLVAAEAIAAGIPMPMIAWTSCVAIWEPNFRPSAICSAVCGVLLVAAPPARDDSGGTSAGVAAKLYTQICAGRGRGPVANCWRLLTEVEAHPAVMASAIRYVTNLPAPICVFMNPIRYLRPLDRLLPAVNAGRRA